MNIDDQIRQSLKDQSRAQEDILVPERGLFGLLANAFTGSMRRWVWLTNILAIVVSVFILWSAWEFFTTDITDQRLFWGICLIVTLQLQIGLKMWIFQEMNRASLMREIKRVELWLAKSAE